MPTAAWPRITLYFLFALSGFAGLIYESIWSHYLKLFLGHAAYAQTLVLVIFMGGMAVGAWLAGEFSTRLRRPLLWYAGAELLLGIAAQIFDPVFRTMQSWMFAAVIPELSSPLVIDLAKWIAAALIILPQSILLGTTFPMMSAGLLRLYPAQSGAALAVLYFSNSIGAAVGVLSSGFVLIAKFGLPGTLLTAGLINCFLAGAVFLLQRWHTVWQAGAAQPADAGRSPADRMPAILLWAAFLTGAASFCYEIAWLRMLSLVLGAATHSFELMLSAFITGLALGSIYIRGRIDRIADRRRWLAWIQIVMGLLALASMPLYMASFDWMAELLGAIQRNPGGYRLFMLASHALCFVLMLPATFCAGMTLPLITAELLQRGQGERSIGRVYGANTLGSITGVIIAVHLVMPLFGLRAVLLTGSAIDIGLGIWLLSGSLMAFRLPQAALLASALVASAALAAGVRFDPQVTGSGVFRSGLAQVPGTVIFHADGKTATVDVFRREDGFTSIATNGKVDAGFMPGGPVNADDYTMVLFGLIPLSMHPAPGEAAVIGMGSGRTSHVLLHDPRVAHLVTVEIEPRMIEGARLFGTAVERPYIDPRSTFVVEDAKTYFARAPQQYDLILSEPSNPWVSGVATLFSREFYAQVRNRVKPGGLFVQWLQLYEMDVSLVFMVLRAVGESFEDFAIYATNSADIIIVSSVDGPVPRAGGGIFSQEEIQPLLENLHMDSPNDLGIRRIATARTLMPMILHQGGRSNSDYYPILDQNAARHRFLKSSATELLDAQPYTARIEDGSARLPGWVHPNQGLDPTQAAAGAAQIANYLDGRPELTPIADEGVTRLIGGLELIEVPCDKRLLNDTWMSSFRALTVDFAAYLPLATSRLILQKVLGSRCESALDRRSRQWLELFAGVAFDDWELTRAAAAAMIDGNAPGFHGEAFVMAELLLADLKSGGRAAARQHIETYHARMPDSFPIRQLRGIVEFSPAPAGPDSD